MRKALKRFLAAFLAAVIMISGIQISTLESRADENTESSPSVSYRVHAQRLGWLQETENGNVAGTVGESKRLEAMEISIKNQPVSGGITYSAHVQGYGWQNWVSDGEKAGTEGESKRIEAVCINLYGEMAEKYDVLYRTHVQGTGWQSWVKNGEVSGTTGESKRIEAIQIKLVNKSSESASVSYTTHVQGTGWQNYMSNGLVSGTTGSGKRLEAVIINLEGSDISGGITYQTHVQGYGWQNWVKGGQIAGTTGESKRIEAIRIKLTGDISAYYDVYYRVHIQTFGWLDWAKNGEAAGSSALSRRLEALQVMLVKKGGQAPAPTGDSYVDGINDIPGEYVIKVNKKMNCVTIYKGGYPVKAMVCSTGEATPLGTFHIGNQYRWQLMIHDVWSQWASVITTNILFHSVPYRERDNHTLITSSYNKLGTTASAGCVRLTCEDAKWIYDNIDRGTTVIIYNSNDPGPLGKPTAQKLPAGQGWDPTDPNP